MTIRRPRPPRVDWTGWEPTGPELASIRALFRRHRRAAIGAYVGIVLVGFYGLWDAQRSRDSACAKINQVSTALRTIVDRGDGNLEKLRDEGTLTEAQFQRSFEQSRAARRLLAPIPCD